jgi:hypothetical protein
MKARAFWTVAPGRGELRGEELLPAPGTRLLRTLASGISRGTEAHVFAGRVPASQHQAMRAPLMEGTFPFPVKYGYSLVGRDEDGRRWFALHPHQDLCRVPEAMCVAVPDAVPTARAVLAANMETALNVVWDAAPLPGERACVIGAGVVGLLVAYLLARMPAVEVEVVDILAARGDTATSLGVGFAPPGAARGECDLVVHASGSSAGLGQALGLAGFEGRIVEASWFADTAPALPLGEAFHSRRLRIIASQVGRVGGAMRGRRSTRERLALALALLEEPVLDALLDRRARFENLPAEMPALLQGGLCHVVEYGEDRCSA